jgi:hypothetical protein
MSRTIVIEQYNVSARDWILRHKAFFAFLIGLVFAVVIVATLKVTEAVALNALAVRAAVAAQNAAAVPDIALPAEWTWQPSPVEIGPMVRPGATGSSGSLNFVMDRNRRRN